jgi:Cu(I)/Ag(I) efflux system membrane fusion protein
MRKNYIDNIIFIGSLFSAIGFISCKNNSVKDAHAGHSKEMTIDSSIASLAKPANAQVISTIPTISPESGTRIFSAEIKGQITYDTRNQTSISSRVAGRIEKLYIKYNYQPVKQGQLIMEIYSPDLAAAQRELLFIARSGNDDNMLSKAKQRLSLLGMQPEQINQVLKTEKILYRVPIYSNATGYILEKQAASVSNAPTTSSSAASTDGMDNMGAATSSSAVSAPSILSTPVMTREGQYVSAGQSLFTIYRAGNVVAEFALKPELASQVKRGQKLIFHTNADAEKVYTGNIGLIQPIVRSGENFTLARVYITNKDLLPGQLVSANIPVVYRGGWWLPRKAIWQSGNKSIVFKKQGDVFVPMQVETSVEAEGMVMVTTAIGDWQVAGNASYLVDSESFIKTTDQQK